MHPSWKKFSITVSVPFQAGHFHKKGGVYGCKCSTRRKSFQSPFRRVTFISMAIATATFQVTTLFSVPFQAGHFHKKNAKEKSKRPPSQQKIVFSPLSGGSLS